MEVNKRKDNLVKLLLNKDFDISRRSKWDQKKLQNI